LASSVVVGDLLVLVVIEVLSVVLGVTTCVG
jgi:hypothetical protein